jgi:hypothetical protein
VRELLEAQQCYLITHFGSEGRDGWTAGVGLRVGSTHKVESHTDLYYCRFQECEFFIYFFCFDFRKKWTNQKFREIYICHHTPRWENFEKLTSATIPHGGHVGRDGANGRLYCQVGPDSCRREARRQES